MIQVSHESPICMLENSLLYNDYDYALVHLFESNPEYFNFYKNSLQSDRKVYLDNSIFELGESFNEFEYIHWISELNPTYYIVPDVLEDGPGTINKLFNFNRVLDSMIDDKNLIDNGSEADCVDCGDSPTSEDQNMLQLTSVESMSGEDVFEQVATELHEHDRMLEVDEQMCADPKPSDFNIDINKVANITSKQIGVVQGKDWNELVECYQTMVKLVDMIAISFDYSYYLYTGRDRSNSKVPPVDWYDVMHNGAHSELKDADPMKCEICKDKLHRYTTGRQAFIQRLIDEGIWDWSKPHHLLGCSTAKEFSYYTNSRTRVENIVSLDTSNPVMAGINQIKYDFDNGLDGKVRGLLADQINIKLSQDELKGILKATYFNTDMFKKIIGR